MTRVGGQGQVSPGESYWQLTAGSVDPSADTGWTGTEQPLTVQYSISYIAFQISLLICFLSLQFTTAVLDTNTLVTLKNIIFSSHPIQCDPLLFCFSQIEYEPFHFHPLNLVPEPYRHQPVTNALCQNWFLSNCRTCICIVVHFYIQAKMQS